MKKRYHLILWTLAGMAVFGQTPRDMFEKGVYAENVLGDLEKAYEHYELAAMDSEAPRELQAKARYRMAVCSIKNGDMLRAKFAVNGLVNGYPDFPDLVAKAKGLVTPDEPEEKSEWPEPTWKDGEFIISRREEGHPTNLGVMHSQEIQHNGTAALRTFLSMNHGPYKETVLVYQVSGTMEPLEVKYLKMGVRAVANGRHIKVVRTTASREYVNEVVADGPFYWYAQRFNLMRMLDYNQAASDPILFYFSPFNQFMETSYKFDERKTIKSPLGVYETVSFGGAGGLVYWLAVNDTRHYVRTRVGDDYYELVGKGVRDLDQPLPYQSLDHGFSLTLPPKWFLHEDLDYSDKSRIHFLSYDPDTGMVLDVVKAEDKVRDLGFTGYEETSRKEGQVAGMPAVLVEGYHRVRNKERTQFQVVFTRGERKYTFTLWTPAAKIEKARKELDEILAGFKPN